MQMQGGQFGGKGKGGFDGGRGKGGPLEPSRSVYVGSLPAGVTLAELSELAVPFGMLESLRWMGQPFAFLNFVELDHAVALWEAGQHGRGPGIWMRGQRLTINWGKAPVLDPAVVKLVENGATRHLRLSNISNQVTRQQVGPLPAAAEPSVRRVWLPLVVNIM